MAGAPATRRRPSLDAEDPESVARFFHGLADPNRVRILQFLLDGPKTAGEIVRHLGRHQPSVSSHLTCLRFCGFVEARREGRSVVYELIDPRVRRLLELGERYLETNAERIMTCRVIAPSIVALEAVPPDVPGRGGSARHRATSWRHSVAAGGLRTASGGQRRPDDTKRMKR